MLPSSVYGLDVIELGCGTGDVSAWLARLGAKPVGIDVSPQQLTTARTLHQRSGLEVPLHLGNAEVCRSRMRVSLWRSASTGGELAFRGNSMASMTCMPLDATAVVTSSERLERPQFCMFRFEWPDNESVEFHLSHGEMLRQLRTSVFEVLDLIEIQMPAETRRTHMGITNEWARRRPSEEIWKTRNR